jgi:hypothetical protein
LFLLAAADDATTNPELAEFARFVERYCRYLPRALSGEAMREQADALGCAERILFKNVGFQNVGEWLAKLDMLRRFEPQPRIKGIGGYGTGCRPTDLALRRPTVVARGDR